jgi:hypothetical protein
MFRIILSGLIILTLSFIFSGCQTTGHGKRNAPGQIKKRTGYNPASGKTHAPKWKKK